MPAPPGPGYTSAHEVAESGAVTFACSTDVAAWPWLELAPQHPVVIQTQNFWSSVGAGAAMGSLDESKWSALTWTDWELGERDAGHAVRGVYERTQVGDDLAFTTRLYDAADRLIVTMRGKGVVFRTRNFEKWREGSKKDAVSRMLLADFDFAPRELLGLGERELPLVSQLEGERARALVSKENGLMPGHPYFSGSGDHVNAPHLAEIARQIASQVAGGAPILVTHGEMDMHRFVELGCPIDIEVTGREDCSVALAVSQLDRSCARLSMSFSERHDQR